MATEEIHLNAALEAVGLEPVETDLGEWIIQLAHETPSHIVVPAIHKSKEQIAELFVEKVGIEPTDDVAVLTQTARRILRERFAEAEVGISGVNFGVAETGTILILENEGNARLTTSLPRTHIAVMGIEKVIPRFADLDVFLKLLPRSGTGQRLTAYQSLITGTKRSADEEGPEEVHIVLMDNGRSRMLSHPVTRQSLACIRCGACLNACPVYQQVGGHAYGSVYPGADRRGHHAAARRHREGGAAPLRFEPVRRVPRGVPGQDRHPGTAPASARGSRGRDGCGDGDAEGAGEEKAAGAARVPALRLRRFESTAVRVGRARRACAAKTGGAGRPHRQGVGPRRQARAAARRVDGVARRAAARRALVPRRVAPGVVREEVEHVSKGLTKIRQFLWRDVVLNPAMVVFVITVLLAAGALLGCEFGNVHAFLRLKGRSARRRADG